MDKRFNPLSPAEELHARRVLAEELAADPCLPIPAVIRKIRASLRLTIAEYAKVDVEREVSSPTLATAEKLLRPMGTTPGAAVKPGQR